MDDPKQPLILAGGARQGDIPSMFEGQQLEVEGPASEAGGVVAIGGKAPVDPGEALLRNHAHLDGLLQEEVRALLPSGNGGGGRHVDALGNLGLQMMGRWHC